MKILERIYEREIDVSAATLLWSYFDTEHLNVVHKNYALKSGIGPKLLHEDGRCYAAYLPFKLPVFSFLRSHSLNFVVRVGEDAIKIVNMGLFSIPSVATAKITEDRKDHCRLTIKAQFFLFGWRRILAPLLDLMMDRWSQRIWDEDLPVRLRRQKVLRLGFKDFAGLPDEVAERRFDGDLMTNLPVARHKSAGIGSWLGEI